MGGTLFSLLSGDWVRAVRARGFVTMDELNAALPPWELAGEQIEDLLATLSEIGIDVLEEADLEPGFHLDTLPETPADKWPGAKPPVPPRPPSRTFQGPADVPDVSNDNGAQ